MSETINKSAMTSEAEVVCLFFFFLTSCIVSEPCGKKNSHNSKPLSTAIDLTRSIYLLWFDGI